MIVLRVVYTFDGVCKLLLVYLNVVLSGYNVVFSTNTSRFYCPLLLDLSMKCAVAVLGFENGWADDGIEIGRA